jgi:hypothetical protein
MKDTFYFQHDTNARWDHKLVKVQMTHQMIGIGVYWCIVEMLYENAGYLPIEYERIAFELRTDKSVIQSIINDFELFENDGVKFWSNNALMQFNERISKSVKASESVKKRWDKYKGNTNVLPTKYYPNTKEERRGENRIEEKKEYKEKKSQKVKIGFFDVSACSEKLQLAIKKWIDYKIARHENYKSQESFNLMVRKLQKLSSNNDDFALDIIEDSMANNYSGFFIPKNYDNKGKSSSKLQSNFRTFVGVQEFRETD